MRVLVTGAGGFLGRHVVAAANQAGHEVVAMVRPRSTEAPAATASIRGDLRQPGRWTEGLDDIDGVIHLAAATSGDLSEQFAGTVVATENLLAALDLTTLRRFVHVSSIAVYDFDGLRRGGELDETCPLESDPERRDPYTITKLLQEDLVRQACRTASTPLVVLRPGAVYGPGKDWGYGVAMRLGRVEVLFSPGAKVPLTYVTNCADALVAALTAPDAPGKALNIVDDDLPTYREFAQLGRRAGADLGPTIGAPWSVVGSVGWALELADRRLAGSRMKLPEVLAARRQRARWLPLQYSNSLARTTLDWRPQVPIRDGVRQVARSEA
jgi:nucleoside-diphosphate-sugar epimerase